VHLVILFSKAGFLPPRQNFTSRQPAESSVRLKLSKKHFCPNLSHSKTSKPLFASQEKKRFSTPVELLITARQIIPQSFL
jgi:hypothetical protein